MSHLKVLDLSRILAGPWASQTLADLGADVIKVERPVQGDDTRQWGPPFLYGDDGNITDESAYFLCANRGKRSICIDITCEKGQVILHKLVAESDILIENFKVDQLKKYQLDYETLSKINPALIYCSITGFGQTGPYRQRPGYDLLMQAMGGLMSVTGEPDGMPQKTGVAITDILTGLYSVIGILAAITERSHSGLGQHIDMSLMDVTAAAMANQATNYLVGGMVPKAKGNEHPNIAPYQTFETSDGYCIVAVGNDRQFERFCNAISQPELAENPSFKTNSHRVKNRDVLTFIIAKCLKQDSRNNWLKIFEEAQVPAAPINNLDDVFNDPQLLSRDMKITIPHQNNSELNLVGCPIKLSRTPIQYSHPPPLLGEHTEEILEQLHIKSNKSGCHD